MYGSQIYSTDTNWLFIQGDSGGPVFRNTNSNTQALAYGFISAGLFGPWEVPCPSWLSGKTCTGNGTITLAAQMEAVTHVSFGPF